MAKWIVLPRKMQNIFGKLWQLGKSAILQISSCFAFFGFSRLNHDSTIGFTPSKLITTCQSTNSNFLKMSILAFVIRIKWTLCHYFKIFFPKICNCQNQDLVFGELFLNVYMYISQKKFKACNGLHLNGRHGHLGNNNLNKHTSSSYYIIWTYKPNLGWVGKTISKL
jgi:hypothetical protein